MSQTRFVETTGDSVEDAIAKGLAELGVGPTEVVVEVLEEPSRGVFGLGSRLAKVRLQLLTVPKPPPMPTTPAVSASAPAPYVKPAPVEVPKREEAPRPAREPKPATDYEVGEDEGSVLIEIEETPELRAGRGSADRQSRAGRNFG